MDHKISVSDAIGGITESTRSLVDRLDRVLMVVRGSTPEAAGPSPIGSSGLMSDLERLAMFLQTGQHKIDELEKVIGNPVKTASNSLGGSGIGGQAARPY